jgi:general secretion pathway protein K
MTSSHVKTGACARRGGALLAVLWLSAALAAVAFSAALMVRAGRERTQNQREGLQAELLADSALEREIYEVRYGMSRRAGIDAWWPGKPFVRVRFRAGDVLVEVIPEATKINVNTAPPEMLGRLMLALGVAPARAGALVAGILNWRSPVPVVGVGWEGAGGGQNPSFRVPHASLQQIEELLSLPAMTPELFYGRLERARDGSWLPRAGLRDCLTVNGETMAFDANSVQPAVLLAAGMPPALVAQLVAMRRQGPITVQRLAESRELFGDAAGLLTIGMGDTVTLRATARVWLPDGKLSALRRTATRTVILPDEKGQRPFRVLESHAGAAARTLEETWPW